MAFDSCVCCYLPQLLVAVVSVAACFLKRHEDSAAAHYVSFASSQYLDFVLSCTVGCLFGGLELSERGYT